MRVTDKWLFTISRRKMKSKSLFSLAVLLLSALACGLPSAAPAEPTVNALPPTPDIPFSASPAPQNPTQPASSPQFSNTIREEFDGKLSPGIGWTWLRQDNANWSLTTTPGWLRINVSTNSYFSGGLPSNVLTISAPQGDFDIRTSLKFSPSQNFEFAGLIVLFDEKSLVQAGRVFCNLGNCPGGGFYFDNLQNASPVGNNFGTTNSSAQSALRIARQGNTYTAYYQTDGVNWVALGSHTVDRQPVSIGLIAAQAQSAGAYAEFDYFVISQP
jgi:beta-xylosidase